MNVYNKTWQRNYVALEEFEAGIVLTGAEAKSAQGGHMKLESSHVKVSINEAWLHNAEIFKYKFDGSKEYDSTRRRRLLLNKKELLLLHTKMLSQPGLTIVATSAYLKHRKVKIKIALVKGRKETEKRRLEKDKQVARKQQQEMKEYIKS